jgi:hypothetical protein
VLGGRATWGPIAAASAAVLATAAPGPASASEYSERIAKKVESEIVYVDPKARPKVSTAEAGAARLRIVKKAPGRVKIAVVPESRAEDEGGVSGLGSAIGRDIDLRGALLVVAGNSAFTLTSHPQHNEAAAAVGEAFDRHKGDRGEQLVAAVNALAAVDPGPSGDPPGAGGGGGAAPDFGDVDDQTDGIFDSVNDAIRTTTIVIAAFFIIPLLALFIWIALRIRRSRREAAGDLDFAQERLRNDLIALGDDIRALEVDVGMPGVNAMGVADYEAAVQQYDRANFALERSDQNPRYMAEAKAALTEGRRRISDAKVRLGVTPTP